MNFDFIINRVGQKMVVYNPKNPTQVVYTRSISISIDLLAKNSVVYWQGTFNHLDTSDWLIRRPTLWESLTRY